MRGTTLSDLLLRLKAELNESLNNTSVNQRFTSLLGAKQNFYAGSFDWDFLKNQRFDVVTTPGTDVYDMPLTLDTGRPHECTVFWNNYFQPVLSGISPQEYNYLNPEQNKQQDPVQRWQESGYRAGNPPTTQVLQFQIWPKPTIASTIRFWGSRVPNPLKQNTDRCDIDDDLLVYSVAADELARLEQKNAPWMAKRAMERLFQVRGSVNQRDEEVNFGVNKNMSREQRRVVPLIVTAG